MTLKCEWTSAWYSERLGSFHSCEKGFIIALFIRVAGYYDFPLVVRVFVNMSVIRTSAISFLIKDGISCKNERKDTVERKDIALGLLRSNCDCLYIFLVFWVYTGYAVNNTVQT